MSVTESGSPMVWHSNTVTFPVFESESIPEADTVNCCLPVPLSPVNLNL